ncbi:MAG: ATP-binding protein [Pseudomonadota bacterium]|nr:ATP-binding protein [Pseudomonadota bacterium]
MIVIGPRQSGKTTLVRDLIAGKRTYLTLDNKTTLLAARTDPTGLVRDLDRAIIDEVQLAPDLLRAIKESIDTDRRPGRFLLTGSANILTLPKISESLAGRMEIVTLLPLSRAEIMGRRSTFLKSAFAGKLVKPLEKLVGAELVRAALIGGYPEMLGRAQPNRRGAWARSYIRAIVQRDVREIVQIEKLDRVPRLLRVLAHHSGQLTNFTQIGGQLGLDDKTTRSYVGILEQLFLVRRVEPWFRNRLSRLLKTPKIHFLDSGLLAVLLGANAERIAANRSLFGPLLETFVFSEILKQETWLEENCVLSFYRDKDQDEVDFVVENELGEIVGIEVKASATVGGGDFKGLKKLAAAAGKDFKLGVVLYDGEQSLPFGDGLYAAPISCLWGA